MRFSAVALLALAVASPVAAQMFGVMVDPSQVTSSCSGASSCSGLFDVYERCLYINDPLRESYLAMASGLLLPGDLYRH